MTVSVELALLVRQLARAANIGGPEKAAAAARPVPKSIDWDRWLRLVDENDLGAFLASRSRANDVPRTIALELRDRYARSGHEAAFRHVETLRLLKALEGKAEPILLKGSALVHTLYAEAAERPMSDVDLLLPSTEELTVASEIFAREGYVRKLNGDALPFGHHHAPALWNSITDLTLELHLNLATPPLPKRVLTWMCRRRVRLEDAGPNVWVLDASSALMHHAIHAMADPVDSPLLRNLFEVAWLASELGSAERSAVRSLALRWGIEPLLAPALSLAHHLFGSPAIVQRPMLCARDLLSKARLEWDDALEEKPRHWSSVRRSIARAHFSALKKQERPRQDWLSFVAVLAKLAGGILAGRLFGVLRPILSALARRLRGRAPAIEPITIASIVLGDRLLAHDARTGNVHLLDHTAARAFTAARVECSPRRLEAVLEANGVARKDAQRAIARLFEKGLVRPAGGHSTSRGQIASRAQPAADGRDRGQRRVRFL